MSELGVIRSLEEVIFAAEEEGLGYYWKGNVDAAMKAVKELVAAAPGALELLAAEGYDGHFESGAPVSPEYERLRAALVPFEES